MPAMWSAASRWTSGGRSRELDGMDARQDLAELARDHRPRLRVGRIAQELARDRRAVDALHDEAFAQPILRR